MIGMVTVYIDTDRHVSHAFHALMSIRFTLKHEMRADLCQLKSSQGGAEGFTGGNNNYTASTCTIASFHSIVLRVCQTLRPMRSRITEVH